MLTTRTPLRISFIGGGSDYPGFFNQYEGCVVGATIDLSVYCSLLQHSDLADSKFILSYRRNENVEFIEDIQHPLVREILLSYYNQEKGLHVSTLADVPASTGLGSSSAFAVSLIQGVSALNGISLDPKSLAQAAIQIERQTLKEAGGWQDQIFASYGGFKSIGFGDGDFEIKSDFGTERMIQEFERRLVLVSAGGSRSSHSFAASIELKIEHKENIQYFKQLAQLASNFTLESKMSEDENSFIDLLAIYMNEAWSLKLKLSENLHPEVISTLEKGLSNGAIAAKLCGAGGSGFIAFVLDRGTNVSDFTSVFESKQIQPVKISKQGSELIYKSQSD